MLDAMLRTCDVYGVLSLTLFLCSVAFMSPHELINYFKITTDSSEASKAQTQIVIMFGHQDSST